jgi:hypothetical protein
VNRILLAGVCGFGGVLVLVVTPQNSLPQLGAVPLFLAAVALAFDAVR